MNDHTITLWMFDFDNTLALLEPEVDWPASRRELEKLLRKAGAPEPLFAEFPNRNLTLYEAYREHLSTLVRYDGGGRTAMLRNASAVIEKYELKGANRALPLEGALDLLRSLRRRKIDAGIVTANSSRTVTRWLRHHRVTKSIKVIVGRDALLPMKPAPHMLLRAIKDAGGTPKHTAFVGDSLADLESAREAKVTFYGIAPSEAARDRLVSGGATDVFSSPAAFAIHLNLDAPPAKSRPAERD